MFEHEIQIDEEITLEENFDVSGISHVRFEHEKADSGMVITEL